MRLMLFGAAGQVGSECVDAFARTNYDVIAMTRRQTDFSRVDQVLASIDQYSPDVVVNACAYTAVDKAETERTLADQINHQSVASLAEACAKHNIPLLHLSTDYVFDGRSSVPYVEESSTNPLSVYGKTKLDGENKIRQNLTRHIILRTSWVFGRYGNNFVKTMLRLANERDSLNIVADQWGRPTYAKDIADVILQLLNRYSATGDLPWGVYHCASSGKTNWYEFACYIFEKAIQNRIILRSPKMTAVGTSEYPVSAPRPTYSVLNTEKLEQLISASIPSWRDGIDEMLSQYH